MKTKTIKTDSDPQAAETIFDQATYFDACAQEEFSNEDPLEAIRERFEQVLFSSPPTLKPSEVLDSICPVEVFAYERDTVSEQWLRDAGDVIFEELVERFADEFGDPDGDFSLLSKDTEAAKQAIDIAIALFTKYAIVWRCSRVASRVYYIDDAAQLLEIEL